MSAASSRRPIPGKPAPVRRGKSKTRRASSGDGGSLILAVLLLAAAGGAGWWWLNRAPSTAPVQAVAVVSPQVEETPAEERTPDTTVSRITAGPRPSGQKTASESAAAVPPAEDAGVSKPADGPSSAPRVKFPDLLVLDELQGGKEDQTALRKQALKLAFESGQWEDYRALLARSLTAWLKPRFQPENPETAAGTLTNLLTREALLRHAFLTRAGDDLQPLLTDNSAAVPLVRWLLDSPQALSAFTSAMLPEDSFTGAMKVWSEIYTEDPASKEEWLELAVACALVFDKGLKESWDGKEKQIDPFARYRFYRDNSMAGRLTGNIRIMRAPELVWVVSAPVPQAELEWALKHVSFRTKSWGEQSYFSIKYDMEKAIRGKSKDPYDIYSFAEIEKKGGICADRSFYGAHTARAHGIPAAVLDGDGERGPHAWMTWMAADQDWQFSGRFAGYPAGHCFNPQTGHHMSEDEIVRWTDRKAFSAARVEKALQLLWLAALYDKNEDAAKQSALLDAALKAAPHLPAAASAMLAHWTRLRAEAPVEEWKKLMADLRKDFRDHKALMEQAAKAEEACVFPRQDEKLAMRTMRREAKKLDDTKGADKGVAASTDRLAEAFRRQADLLKEKKDLEGIRSVYRRALADHGGDPALFKALGRDLFSYLKDDAALAGKACFDLDNACRRQVGRGGSGDWFDITSQNSAWKMVADCWQKTGETRKADEIRKDMKNREAAAKRRAL